MLCGAGLEPLSPMMGGMLHTDLYKWLSKYYPEEGHALKPFQGRPFNVLEQFEDLLPRIPKADENDAELERLMNKASKVMYDDTQTQHTRYLALEAVVKRLAFLGPDAPTQPPPASTQPPPPPYRSGFLHILRKLKRPPPPQGARRVIPPPPPPPAQTALERLRSQKTDANVSHRGVDPGSQSPSSPTPSSPSSPTSPKGKGMLFGGLSPQAGFVMRMMAENKKKHSGQYKKPTDPSHPESTMSSWRPFDYKKLANNRQGGESNTGYGASPFIQKHFKNGTVAYAPRGPNHQHLRDRGQPAEDEGQRNARKARRNLVALLRQAGVALPQATQQALAEVPQPQAEAPPPLEEAPPPPKRATPYKSGFKNILEKLKKPEPKNKGGRPKKEYEFKWDDPNYNKKAKGRPKQTEEEKTFATGKTQAEREAEAEDERTGFHEGKWQEHEDRDKQEQEEAEARRKQKGRKYGLHKVEEKKEADRKAEAQRRKEEEEDRREAERERQREEREAQRKRDHEERIEAIKRAKKEEVEERQRQKEAEAKKKADDEAELNRNTILEIPVWWKTLRKVKSMERKTQSDSHFEWFRGLAVTVRESKDERLATLTKTFLKWLFMKCLPSKGWQFVEYEPTEKDFPPAVESNSYQLKDKQGKEIPGGFGYKNGKERISGDRIALMGITSYYANNPPTPSEHPLPSKMFIIVPPTGVGYVLYGRPAEQKTVFDWDGITECFIKQDYSGNASRPITDGTFNLHIQMMKEGDHWVNMVDRFTEGSEYRRNDMPRKEKIPYIVNGRKVEEFGLFNKDIMPYFNGILKALDGDTPVPEETVNVLPVEPRKIKIKAPAPQTAVRFPEGVKPPRTEERALIVAVHKAHPTMTIRTMPGYIAEHYDGFVVSQAEVQRKIRLYKEGKMDADGKML